MKVLRLLLLLPSLALAQQQFISFGTGPNSNTGTTLYAGGQLINQNFSQLYGEFGAVGLLKGQGPAPQPLIPATATDVISLWSSATYPCNSTTYLRADGYCAPATGSGGGAGTVTSVAITVPSGFTVTGSPITGGGTLAIGGILNTTAGGTGTASPALVAGTHITITGAWPNQTIAASGGGTGTVTSIALTAPSWLTVGGSPVTTSGTLALTSTSQSANLFLASPNGSAGVMTPRAIALGDLPLIPLTSQISGILPVANGGSGAATLTGPIKGNGTSAFSAAAAADIYGLWSGTCSSSTYLNGAGVCTTPSGAGTVTTTGSPASPELAGFTGSSSISGVNLTGDVTTSGTLATTVGSIGGEAVSLAGSFTTSGAHALTFTTTGATNVTLPTSGTLVANTVTSLGSLTSAAALATVGTIGTGVWQGTVVAATYGGTGEAGTITGILKGNATSAHTAAASSDVIGLWTGTCSSSTWLNGAGACTAPSGAGTVTSVGLSDGSTTPIFTITGSPVTASGTLTETLKTETANTVFAGPTSGSAAQPAFRALVSADIPTTLNSLTSATSLAAVGTITTGTWDGNAVAGTYGGTGINNGANTINLNGNNFAISGGAITLTASGATSVALPITYAELPAIANGTVLGNYSGSSATPTAQTAALITSGTSGGILGFTSSTGLASSAALTAATPTCGGGAGATPADCTVGQLFTFGVATQAGANAFTGANTFTSAAPYTFPLLSTNTDGTTNYPGVLRALAPNLATSNSVSIDVGVVANVTNNLASLAFNYVGSGSASNTVSLHLFNGVDGIKIDGAGDVFAPAVTTGTNTDFACFASGGKFTLQTSACTISSLRFKIHVADWLPTEQGLSTGALDELLRFEVKTFQMKPGEASNPDPNYSSVQIGLIAEDIAKIEPRCAIYEQDMKTPKSYRQECVIAMLVKGIQEEQQEIDYLKSKLPSDQIILAERH